MILHVHIHDGIPTPIYACMPLAKVSADALRTWTRSIGLTPSLDQLHVTVAWSRESFDHESLSLMPGFVIQPVGRQLIKIGDVVALEVESSTLTDRWARYQEAGASWDYDRYVPHISIATVLGNEARIKDFELGWHRVEVFNEPITLEQEQRAPLRE